MLYDSYSISQYESYLRKKKDNPFFQSKIKIRTDPKNKPLLFTLNNLVSRSTTTDDVFILSEKNDTLMPIGPSGRVPRRPSIDV